MHRKWLCVLAAAAFLSTQTAVARNIFLTSGDFTNPLVSTFSSDPLSFGTSIGSVGGAFTVLPSGSASKYYAITRSATDTVVALEGRFPNLSVTRRVSLNAEATGAAVSPDGRRLVVITTSGVAVIDTGTDQVVFTATDVGSNLIDVAVSIDSTRAFVLSAGSSRITALNLGTTTTAGPSAQLTSTPTGVTVAPTGVVYVSAEGGVVEIDGRDLSVRAAISSDGTPGKLQFTPGGRWGVAPNASVFSTRAAYLLDTVRRTVTGTSATPAVSLTRVAVVDDATAYGLTAQGGLYVLAIGADGAFSVAPVSFAGSTIGRVDQLVTTGEFPRSRYLILSSGNQMFRLTVATNELSQSIFQPTTGNLSAVLPPTPGAAANAVGYNTTQTVRAGGVSLPLAVRVYDNAGILIGGVPVVFSSATPGVTFSTASTISSFEGIASTTVTLPSSLTTGSVSVVASVQNGQRTIPFTITIGDPQLPGPGTGLGPGSTTRTGLQIVSGQGQVLGAGFSTSVNLNPLTVRLTNASGAPIVGTTVEWTVVTGQGSGNIVPVQLTTDSSGLSSVNFVASQLLPSQLFVTNAIRAAANGQEVIFYVTSVPNTAGGPGTATIQFVSPADRIINARAGETLPGAIIAQVSATTNGIPLPFVGMQISDVNVDPTIQPAAQCRGGFAFSDTQGVMRCDLVVGGRTGQTVLDVIIGGTARYSVTLNVTAGVASQVRILSGNNQSGNPGQQLTPLQVEVADAGGNLLPSSPITWEVPNSLRIVSQSTSTDISGRASLTVALGTTPGPVTVRARAGTGVAEFTLTTNAVAGGLEITGGNGQGAIINQPFAQPVTVRVTNPQGQPLAGATVAFSVTSGSGAVGQRSVVSDANGLASTTVTAGSNVGALVITAQVGDRTATINLTVRPIAPVVRETDILNAASFQPGVSPGSLAYIRVANIAPAVRGTVEANPVLGNMPTRLAGVEVLFNGISAPILAVSNINNQESVVVMVPTEVQPGAATVTIRSDTAGEATVPNVQILSVKPGVFTFADVSGFTYAVATRPNGSYITSANPARRGEIIRMYATGLGPTQTVVNSSGVSVQQVAGTVIAGVNNAGVRLLSAEAVPGLTGVFSVALEIPADTAAGSNQPLGLAVTGPDGQPVFANSAGIPII